MAYRGWESSRAHVMLQQLAQAMAQLFDGEVPFNFPADGHADAAGFFGNDYGNGVGFLGDTNTGAVPSSELRGQHGIHGQRQEAGGGGDAVPLNDDGAIVQRRTGAENGGQQVVGKMGIQWYSALDIGAQTDLTLDHHQRAGLVLAKQVGS